MDPSLIPILLGLAATGAVAGLIAGLFGVGGGIVIVPALYYIAGFLGVAEAVRMHVAVGTSLAVIVVAASASVLTHWRLGAVDAPVLRSYGPGVFTGVIAGTAISAFVPGAVLTAVFAAIALAVAINMATGEPRRRLGAELPGPGVTGALGAFTGMISTMSGIGGGAMTIAILTLYSRPIHIAVGTAAAVGVIVAAPGALGFLAIGWGAAGLPPASAGYVNLVGFAVIAPLTAISAPIGARLAHRLPRRALARAFAVLLAAAALRMIWGLAAGDA
ncbi:MAG: sulfite exporter TauE/SafE family protein [Alphaproteobacteria bacterium]|nr:sulfite exporter TauE/SafE family protein [Alphaproteobacteria bacterium]